MVLLRTRRRPPRSQRVCACWGMQQPVGAVVVSVLPILTEHGPAC